MSKCPKININSSVDEIHTIFITKHSHTAITSSSFLCHNNNANNSDNNEHTRITLSKMVPVDVSYRITAFFHSSLCMSSTLAEFSSLAAGSSDIYAFDFSSKSKPLDDDERKLN